jgi:Ca2+-binding RTX toxin-like protein
VYSLQQILSEQYPEDLDTELGLITAFSQELLEQRTTTAINDRLASAALGAISRHSPDLAAGLAPLALLVGEMAANANWDLSQEIDGVFASAREGSITLAEARTAINTLKSAAFNHYRSETDDLSSELYLINDPDELLLEVQNRLQQVYVGGIQNDDTLSTPTYTFSKSAEAVDEGSSLAIGVSTTNVPPGSPLYWRFSGAGITASDFSDGLLEGSTLLGIDGRAAFSKAIATDAANDPDETLELRFYSDEARSQQVGSSLSVLLKQPSVGLITDGSDRITGSSGAETLIGVPTGSTLQGQGSLDRLTGGGGDDLFVLGNAIGRFYDDGTPGLGSADLALVTDFNAGDRIQLHGVASDYRLISGRYAGVAGVRIDALSPNPEAIGFVQGSTLASLNLANSSQFLFV